MIIFVLNTMILELKFEFVTPLLKYSHCSNVRRCTVCRNEYTNFTLGNFQVMHFC
jgi:hypothetical protein